MSRCERALVLLVRFEGAALLLALPAAFLPTEWMSAIHAALGMGELPRAPLVEYLTRSLSGLYAIWGPLYLFVSLNVRYYLSLLRFLAVVKGTYGVGLLLLDLWVGLPVVWTGTEGAVVIALSLAQYLLARHAQQVPQGLALNLGEQMATEQPRPARTSVRRGRTAFAVLAIGAVLALGGGVVYYNLIDQPDAVEPEPPAPEPAPAVVAAAPEGPDKRSRRLVVGTWEDDYQGKRTMTLKEDGTGTMVVELSGIRAIGGSRLRFDMKWSLENQRLKKRTVGGEPSFRVQAILKMMGDSVDEPILELTEKRLLLQDKDGKTKYDWRRPPAKK